MAKAETNNHHSSTEERTKRPPDLHIICASTSTRRSAFLVYAFPEAKHLSLFAGIEPEIENVVRISKGKIDFVRPHIPTMKDGGKSRKIALAIAADTNTRTLSLNKEGTSTYLENHGKPKEINDVLAIFLNMHRAHELDKTPPYYQVHSGSNIVIRTFNKEEKISGSLSSTIELDPEKVNYFSTAEGFREYLNAFKEFYSSSFYSNNGSHHSIEVTDISGGISLPVLVSQGAVISIDGTRKGKREFSYEFKKALYNAGVGFSPNMLSSIQPEINKIIDNWPWLNQVANYAQLGSGN